MFSTKIVMASTFSPPLSAQAGGEPDQVEKIFDRQRVQLSGEGFGSSKIKALLLNMGRNFKTEGSLQSQDFCCVVRWVSCSKNKAFLLNMGRDFKTEAASKLNNSAVWWEGLYCSKNKAFLFNMGENFNTEAASNFAEGRLRLTTRRCSLSY